VQYIISKDLGILSQRASYIGAIQADQTVESDHSDLLVQWGTHLPGHVLLQIWHYIIIMLILLLLVVDSLLRGHLRGRRQKRSVAATPT
jgi:hypothetical protein